MSTSSITPTFTRSLGKRQAAEASSASLESVEERRWLLMLGLPFVASSCFFAATIGTGILWLLAPAMIFGPGLLILAFVYLGISSDTNGSD